MHIEPFGVEIWMNEFEASCELNLAETCVESVTVAELLALCKKDEGSLSEVLPFKMTYGHIEGSDRLRDAIAALYEKQKRENILVTHGTIGANSLVHQALVSHGDKVISVIPTYQQHYSIPDSIGADIQLLHLRPENGFLPDLDELRGMATPGTRLIAINNPNNPTGSLMDRAMLEDIAGIAHDAGAWLLCDEVYRGTDQGGSGTTASIADLYEKGISTAGMSKALVARWMVGLSSRSHRAGNDSSRLQHDFRRDVERSLRRHRIGKPRSHPCKKPEDYARESCHSVRLGGSRTTHFVGTSAIGYDSALEIRVGSAVARFLYPASARDRCFVYSGIGDGNGGSRAYWLCEQCGSVEGWIGACFRFSRLSYGKKLNETLDDESNVSDSAGCRTRIGGLQPRRNEAHWRGYR